MTATSSPKVNLSDRLVPRKPIDFIFLFSLLVFIGLFFSLTQLIISNNEKWFGSINLICIVYATFLFSFYLLEGPKNLKNGYVIITDRKGMCKRATKVEGDWLIPFFEKMKVFPQNYSGIKYLEVDPGGRFKQILIEIHGVISQTIQLNDFASSKDLFEYTTRIFSDDLEDERSEIISSLYSGFLEGRDRTNSESYISKQLDAVAVVRGVPVNNISITIHAEIK